MKALLIGINYIGTANELQGCINDVIQTRGLIADAYRFDINTVITLRDDDPSNMPTRARILQELRNLVAVSSAGSTTFLHYSGHGTQITDTVGDETDGLEECIVPCDYRTAGFITDNDINTICRNIKGVGIALFDSCRSGTIMDLPYTGIHPDSSSNEGFYCFSGCTDTQDAQEGKTGTSGSGTGLPQGVMTLAFMTTIRDLNYFPFVSTLLASIQGYIAANGYTQTPQLTSTVPVALTTPYPFLGPNLSLIQTYSELNAQIAINQRLQALLQPLQEQAALVPALQVHAALVPGLQASVQQLQTTVIDLRTQTINLQASLKGLPALKAQAALVRPLQNQLALLPGLQNQIEILVKKCGGASAPTPPSA